MHSIHIARPGLRRQITAAALIIFCTLLTVHAVVYAASEQEVIALNFLKHLGSGKQIASSEMITSNALDPSLPEIETAYLANLAGGGYILVAFSHELNPIKAYSLKTDFDSLPPPYRDYIIKEMEYNARAVADAAQPAPALQLSAPSAQSGTSSSWNYLLNYDQYTPPTDLQLSGVSAYTPDTWLLSSSWGQGYPFNKFLPDMNGEKVIAGCVNVAIGQLLNYYQYPATGNGVANHTWNNQELTTITARDFNWAIIPDAITGTETTYQIDELALLLADLGIANQTDFSPTDSGASINTSRMIENFGLSTTMRSMTNAAPAAFYQKIHDEIDAGHPLLFSFPGHMTVADGYSSDLSGQRIHINMGWTGTADDFYYLEQNVNAGGYTFQTSPGALDIHYNVIPCSQANNDCFTAQDANDTVNTATQDISGQFDYENDEDLYDLYLQGDTTIRGQMTGYSTANQFFYLFLYDKNHNLIAQNGTLNIDREINLTGLTPGKYTLRVSLSNHSDYFTFNANAKDYIIDVTTTMPTDQEKTNIDNNLDIPPVINRDIDNFVLNASDQTPIVTLIDARDQNGDPLTLTVQSSNPQYASASLNGNLLSVASVSGSAGNSSTITVTASAGGQLISKSFVTLINDQTLSLGKSYTVTGRFDSQDDVDTFPVILDGDCQIIGDNGYSNQAFFSFVHSEAGDLIAGPAYDDIATISGTFNRNIYQLKTSLFQFPDTQSGIHWPFENFGEGNKNYTLTVQCPDADESVTTIANLLGISYAPPPTASFTLDQQSGFAPLLVQFTDTSTGSVTQWSWDFGDGGSSTSQSPAHTFSIGTHLVSLTVTGPGGSSTYTATSSITATSSEDTDQDGMPDTWETMHNLSTTENNASSDPDNDGLSNLDEYFHGTDPNVANTAVSGRVYDAGGAPLSGIWIEAISPSASFSATTDSEGLYYIPVKPAADYRIAFWADDGYQTTFADNATKWEDAAFFDLSTVSSAGVDFYLQPGVAISGTVTGLSNGDKAVLEAWSPSAESWQAVPLTATGSPLSFTLTGLANVADYRLKISADSASGGYLKNSATGELGSWESAQLIAGGTSGIAIALTSGRIITGTISGLAAGDTLSIDAWSESTRQGSSTVITAVASTENYTLIGIPAQDDILLSINSTSYLNGFFSGTPGNALVGWPSAARLDLSGADASGIDLILSQGRNITGTVTGLSAGDTAWVQAWSQSTGSSGITKLTGTGSALPYTLAGLSIAPDFFVSISSEGYHGGFYSTAGTTNQPSSEKISTAGADVSGIDLSLISGKSISGTITGLDPGERAVIEAWSSETWSWGTTQLTGSISGDDIFFTITGLANSSDYQVNFKPEFHAAALRNNIKAQHNPTNINFVAQTAHSISGTISGVNAYQWLTVEVLHLGDNLNSKINIQADANGNATYIVNGLTPQNGYQVGVKNGALCLFYNSVGTTTDWNNASTIDISLSDQTGIDVDLGILTTYAISGTIANLTDNRAVWIDAWDSSNGYWNNTERIGNGAFSIDLIAGGTYKLGFYAPGTADAYYTASGLTTNPDEAEAIPINSSQILGILNMITGSSITGMVCSDTDNSGVCNAGESLADIFVQAAPNSRNKGVVTDLNGCYAIDGLPDGTYTVSVISSYGSKSEAVVISGSDVIQDIVLGGNSTGSLSGSVTDLGNSSPAASVLVILLKGNAFVNAAYTDANGQFSFLGLSNGNEYTVSVDVDMNGQIDGSCMKTITGDTTCPTISVGQ